MCRWWYKFRSRKTGKLLHIPKRADEINQNPFHNSDNHHTSTRARRAVNSIWFRIAQKMRKKTQNELTFRYCPNRFLTILFEALSLSLWLSPIHSWQIAISAARTDLPQFGCFFCLKVRECHVISMPTKSLETTQTHEELDRSLTTRVQPIASSTEFVGWQEYDERRERKRDNSRRKRRRKLIVVRRRWRRISKQCSYSERVK